MNTFSHQLPIPGNLRVFVLTLVACFSWGPVVKAADPGPAPSGVYTMAMFYGGRNSVLGTLEIRDKTYRLDEKGAFAAFTQDGAGNITWSAGLDFLPEGWKLGKSTFAGLENGVPLIKIKFTTPSNVEDTVYCKKEK